MGARGNQHPFRIPISTGSVEMIRRGPKNRSGVPNKIFGCSEQNFRGFRTKFSGVPNKIFGGSEISRGLDDSCNCYCCHFDETKIGFIVLFNIVLYYTLFRDN